MGSEQKSDVNTDWHFIGNIYSSYKWLAGMVGNKTSDRMI